MSEESMTFQFDPEEIRNVESHLRSEGYPFFSFLSALWGMLLARYMDQSEIELTCSTAQPPEGRGEPQAKSVEPHIAPVEPQAESVEPHTTPVESFSLVISLDNNDTLRTLAARAAGASGSARATKVAESAEPAGAARASGAAEVSGASGAAEPASRPKEMSHFRLQMAKPDAQLHGTALSMHDIVLFSDPDGAFRLACDNGLHEAWFIKQVAEHLALIVSQYSRDPDCRALSFPLVTDGERRKILIEWNNTEITFPEDMTLHRLFEEQAGRTPDLPAVVYRDDSLTYRELNERANQLAHTIRAHYRNLYGEDVLPDTPIGICMNRSAGMAVAMIGILKAGCAYVPLDPAYPTDRLRFMMDDARAPLIITESVLLEKLLFLNELDYGVISLDSGWNFISRYPTRNPEPVSGPVNLAYVIYTSGSTGRPKGVMINHRNVVNFVFNEISLRGIKAGDRLLEFASISFDAAVADIYPALLSGAALHIGSDDIRKDPEELFEYYRKHSINGTTITPAVLHAMPRGELPALTAMVVGGDVCDSGDVRFWSSGRKLINQYGPTECTVGTTELVFGDDTLYNEIGRPLSNMKVYILDSFMNPVPAGVAGELFIGGTGVGRGYLNKKELTGERFVNNPFATEEERKAGRNLLLYKSGDRVRWRSSGSIEFLGRVDFQVKIRGFRIEPGEIEEVLARHGGIKECAVVPCQEGRDKRLAAYFTPVPGSSPALSSIKAHLRQKLPEYMIPAVFIMMESLPLSTSRKIDRRALPAPEESIILKDTEAAKEYIEPRDSSEYEVFQVFSQILNIEKISINEDIFDLGAHSLMAAQIASELRKKFCTKVEIRDIFEYPTIEKLAAVISRKAEKWAGELISIPKAEHRHYIPLTFQQEQVWFLSKLVPNNRAYNFQVGVRFKGKLDLAVMNRAISEIIRRHEILRTTFQESSYGPVQVVHAPWKADIAVTDLTYMPEGEREKEADRLMEIEISKPFDYTRLPLLKWILYRLGEEEHILLHMEHHFVHDGWEVSLFFKELKTLYTAYLENRESPLEEIPIQYADFAIWQRNYLSGPILEEKLSYWINKIKDYPQIVNLPQDHHRSSVQSFNGGLIRLELKELYHRLRDFSRANKVTLFNTMFSAFAVLISKYSRQMKFLVGTGVANRSLKETEKLIGMFVNTVLLYPDLSENPSFKTLIRTTKECMLQDTEHHDLPFMHIVERMKAGNTAGRNPLFQVLFAFHDSPVPYFDFAGMKGNLIIKHNATAKTDINVICIPRAEQHAAYKEGKAEDEDISILWEYNSDLFDRDTMQGMFDHYVALLEEVITHPEKRVHDIDTVLPEERERILKSFNDYSITYDKSRTISDLFLEQVRKRPDKKAVIHNGKALTYMELNGRANAVANRLRQIFRDSLSRELVPDTPVGICVERSIDMIVGILGIMKAGGAYLPLPPKYPQNRLRFMMDDSDVKVVLTQQDVEEKLPLLAEDGRIVLPIDEESCRLWPDSEPETINRADDLLYIIYTSGSTGNPKGVCISHRAVHNYFLTIIKEVLSESDVLTQTSNYAFDASVYEFWGALLSGGTLVIIDSEKIENLDLLKKEIRDNGITAAFFTTALFNAIIDCDVEILTGLSSVSFGGEAVNTGCVKKLLEARPESLKIVHAYGPTETTCYGTYCILDDSHIERDRIPIGRPLYNYSAYVLDEKRNPVPIGVPGELYIGGDSLARGYLNRPDLTMERFVDNPFATAAERAQGRNLRLYRTGDLVRWHNEGTIEFLGRVDFQVKIRGFRIELEEIESKLIEHAAVKQCAVVPWEQQLIAYWVPQNPDLSVTVDELKSFLSRSLPEFMIPTAFIRQESFHLTSNFKVDRSKLPPPRVEDLAISRRECIAAVTETEETLLEIWKELLNLENISTGDSFFELGGNSILTVRMLSGIKRKLGAEVTLAQMFAMPTIRGIASHIDGTGITSGTVDDNLSVALHDARKEIETAYSSAGDHRKPAKVLLTGATGFLGVYLLDALIFGTDADVYCLARGGSELEKRLNGIFALYRKDHLRQHGRIKLLQGDLETEGLGMDREILEMLKSDMDSIYHCGATVHHMYDYRRLRKANVEGTVELLKIAASGRKKSFNYISTLGTASIRDDEGRTVEVDSADGPVSSNGYTLSKWVCERILERAEGMDINIFRPGNITGDSRNGICTPERNHTLLRVKGCLQMKAAPDWKRTTEMMPVDVVGMAVVKLSLVSEGFNIYNLNNPLEISWREYMELFRQNGFEVAIVPENIWREKYLEHIDEKNALYAIKEFYTKEKKEPASRHWKPIPQGSSQEVMVKLKALGVDYPESYSLYMKTVIEYLIESGFLAGLLEKKEVAHV